MRDGAWAVRHGHCARSNEGRWSGSSEKTVDVIGRAILNCYGGLLDCADGATSVKGSILLSTNEVQNKPSIA